MDKVSRRIIALKRARQRRERVEAELRNELDLRRREQADLQLRVEEALDHLVELDAIAARHRTHIVNKMTGVEPFSIDAFDGYRRYLEVIEAKVLEAQAELDTRREAVVAKDQQIIVVRRAIAQNRGRIDICRKRATQLERRLDQIQLDAEDEAAEELVLARRTLA